MKEFIKKIPLPFAGVMLASAALGNLLQIYSEGFRTFFGTIAFAILLLLILKIIIFPNAIAEDMKNPILAGVSATFPMGIMLLSVYMKPFLANVSTYIWYLAILLHISLIIYFTLKFIVRLEMKKVFATYFIVYVGIAAASITAPTHGGQWIGILAFWFGFISFFPLLFLVGYRYIKLRNIPEPAQPLLCIFAAPVSLCLAGYIQSFSNRSAAFIMFMMVLSVIFYFVGFAKMIACLKFKFYPSYTAFTFPFVISAIALRQAITFLEITGPLQFLVTFQTIIAVILVVYTLIRYIMFLTGFELKTQKYKLET